MRPFLSIVIVNYNYGRFLADAIDSILSQCGNPFCTHDGLILLPLNNGEYAELIIVDGKSTDNSVDVIKNYKTSIAWWISEPDKGQSDAFNKGFSHAHGKYGFWLNADDLLVQGSLKRVVEYLKKYPQIEWLGGGMIWLNADKTIKKCCRSIAIPLFLSDYAPGWSVGGPSSIFSLELLNKVGGFDINLHYGMDADLWFRFFRNGTKLNMLPYYLWTFRLHDSSKTASIILEGKISDKREKENNLILARYGRNSFCANFAVFIIKILKMVCFVYLKSFLDTKKFKGKSFTVVQ